MAPIIHGMTGRPEHSAWQAMIQRCNNPNSPLYSTNGELGIGVCDEWENSFEAFFDDLGSRPGKFYNLRRIDFTKDYKPGNVKWVSKKELQNTNSTNHKLSCNGTTLNVIQWAERTGIKTSTIYARLRKGWSVKRTLSTPVRAYAFQN